jgi:hypothetical protein
MKTIEDAISNIDQVIAKARASSLRFLRESEDRFIESVTSRGAMKFEQALSILDEQRAAVLDELDENMKRLRAWILRGGTDSH